MMFLQVGTAAIVTLSIMGAVVAFHVLVIAGIVPNTVVWGGRITDPDRVVRAEIGSVVIVLVAGAVVALRWRSIALGNPGTALAVATWVLAGLFAVNTIGSLFAKTVFERLVFTPLTLVLALLMVRLALS